MQNVELQQNHISKSRNICLIYVKASFIKTNCWLLKRVPFTLQFFSKWQDKATESHKDDVNIRKSLPTAKTVRHWIGLHCNARDFHQEESQTFQQMGNTRLLWKPVLLHPASSPDTSAGSTALCRAGDDSSAGPPPLFEESQMNYWGWKHSTIWPSCHLDLNEIMGAAVWARSTCK